MKELRQVTRFAVLGLMLSGLFAGSMFAQAQQGSDDKNRRDRVANETTMTGCLTKDTGSNYTLTDEKTGVKTTVTGASDLEKHSSNHKVKLTGVTKTDASGNQVFEVTSIEHVSASCKAPSQ